MSLKQQRLARTRNLFGSEKKTIRQALPTITKHHKKDLVTMSNRNEQRMLRLPSLMKKPERSPSVCVNFGGYSDRPKIRLEEEAADNAIRQIWVPGQRWKLGDMIGSGVSGEIFKTLLVKSGRTIAIKRLEKNLTESEENEEVKILSRLRHENIIEFYGSESNSQHVLIFMEYVTEKSLGHLVAEYGPLEETTIKIYLRQILEAFAYIHKQSIIHRDIKASNILVSAVGQIKVTDFGCATIISPTQEKYFNGSVLWSAPEVLQSGQYTISSDVWSLGCLIIELLTGQTPWTERNFDNEMSAIYEIGSNRILPEIPQGVSRPLHDIINRCLQFDPEKRASCQSLLEHSYFN